MKIYIIMHEGSPSILKAESWVDVERIGRSGVFVKSVRAFLRKKDAKQWLKDKGWGHLEIKTAEVLR